MKTKQTTYRSIVLCVMMMFIVIGHWACSAEDEGRWAAIYPSAAATTQAAEAIQRRIDPVAQAAEQAAQVVQQAAQGAATLGVPGAGAVALIASGIGTLLGIYNERRRGTTPLKSAITQIVQSVDAAFPNRTVEQKAALASMQDQATKRLVSDARNG